MRRLKVIGLTFAMSQDVTRKPPITVSYSSSSQLSTTRKRERLLLGLRINWTLILRIFPLVRKQAQNENSWRYGACSNGPGGLGRRSTLEIWIIDIAYWVWDIQQ